MDFWKGKLTYFSAFLFVHWVSVTRVRSWSHPRSVWPYSLRSGATNKCQELDEILLIFDITQALRLRRLILIL